MSANNIATAYGHEVAQRWLQTGWPKELQALVRDAQSENVASRVAAATAMAAFMGTLATALQATQNAGVRFSVALPTPARLAYVLMHDTSNYAKLAGVVIEAATELRRLPINITWPQAGELATTHRPGATELTQLASAAKELAAAAQSMVKAEQPARAEPLEINIVGMPPRETTTTVVRDNRDNLLSTTQVERDAP